MDDEQITGGTTADPEPNQQLAKIVERWEQGRRAHREAFKTIRNNRKVLSGKKAAGKKIRTKLIYSTLQGLLPHVFAQNPQISASPSDAADLTRQPYVKQFAQTLQVVCNQQLRAAGLKRIAKRCVRASYATKVGWAKVGYQRDIRTDPVALERMNDVQDNINRLQVQCDECEADEKPDMEAKLEDLRQMEAALGADVEVTLSEGLTLDYVPATYLVVDPSIDCLEDYRQAGWMDQTIYMSPERVRSQFAVELKTFTHYSLQKRDDGDEQPAETSRITSPQGNEPVLAAVHEHWDHDTMHVYTWVEGHDKWLREPFMPGQMGEQWFPYFPLMLLKSEGAWWPTDLVELLELLVEEYNEIREDKAKHRKVNVPGYVGSKEFLLPEDAKKLQVSEHGEITAISTSGQPIDKVLSPRRLAPMSPTQYDAADVLADIGQVSGLPDAARGQILKAKTATEADILQDGLASRTASNQDDVEDWINDIYRFSAAMLLQQLEPAEVERIAGPGGAAVWPELSKDEAYDLVDLDIRAGSAGKPNKQREQESWAAVAPIIAQLIDKMRNLILTQFSPAPEIEQLKETLRRFDERIDVDEYIPPEVAAFMQQTGGGEGAGGAEQGNVLPFAAPSGGLPAIPQGVV